MSGTNSASATAILATPRTLITASATPRKWLPVSPMKTRAGGRLNTRKPQQQPISAPLRMITPFCTSPGPWTRLTAASISTVATMPTTPAATPSEPSRRLIDTSMPSTKIAVIGAGQPAELDQRRAVATGDREEVDGDPEHGHQHPGAELDGQLGVPGEVEDVVDEHRDGDRRGDRHHLPAVRDRAAEHQQRHREAAEERDAAEPRRRPGGAGGGPRRARRPRPPAAPPRW